MSASSSIQQYLKKVPFRGPHWKLAVFSLYRRILTVHRTKLLPAQRMIGDAYVRQEFSLNKKANEKQAHEFLREWDNYCSELENQQQDIVLGRDMNPRDVEQMDDEMKEQLLKLKQEAEAYLNSVKQQEGEQFKQEQQQMQQEQLQQQQHISRDHSSSTSSSSSSSSDTQNIPTTTTSKKNSREQISVTRIPKQADQLDVDELTNHFVINKNIQ